MRFLVIEGVDGAGKSTIVRAVCAHLSGQGQDVLTLREPGSTAVGERVRNILLDPTVGELHPWTEAALFTACRAQMVREIVRPALDGGRMVVLDRYFYSTVCYQGCAGGLEADLLFNLSEQAVGELQPDRVLLLDLPASVAMARLSGAHDRMEAKGEEYMERVRQGYLQLARKDADRWTVLDASAPEDEVIQSAMAALQRDS